uniref:Putative ovule protein n=1 Tax=Solanum chacoense TaxID=4108 RepID=A0A0V0HSN9_SOLCH
MNSQPCSVKHYCSWEVSLFSFSRTCYSSRKENMTHVLVFSSQMSEQQIKSSSGATENSICAQPRTNHSFQF